MTDQANTSTPIQTRPPSPLWTAWLAYWNGDLSQAERLISPEFVAHAAPLTGVGPSEIHGRDGINGWITGAHAVMQGLHFEVQVGPFVDGEFVLGRWRARGTFQGMPGMPQDGPRRAVDFTGTDTLRVVDGRIVEYWANADSLLFMQQIGAIPQAQP